MNATEKTGTSWARVCSRVSRLELDEHALGALWCGAGGVCAATRLEDQDAPGAWQEPRLPDASKLHPPRRG